MAPLVWHMATLMWRVAALVWHMATLMWRVAALVWHVTALALDYPSMAALTWLP